MCYSVKTSIISYSLGMGSAAFAFYTKQTMLGVLILLYAQMQLSEAIIWRGIDTNNTNLNRIGTSYGKYLLPTHNIAIGLGVVFSAILIEKRSLDPKDFIPLIIGLIFFGAIMILYANTKSANTTYPANQCQPEPRNCQNWGNRLKWPFPHLWYVISYVISLCLLFTFYNGPQRSKIFLLTSFSVLFAATFLIWPRSVGSMWCFSTSLFAPFIVGINYLLL